MNDLVTGEAVVLDQRPALLPSRAVAFAIDLAVQLVMLVGLVFITSPVMALGDDALVATVVLTTLLVVFVGYPALVETLSRGRSLGKLALGLRVVRDDGGPVKFRHALTRALAGVVVDFWIFGLFGVVGMVVSLVSSRGKRVGDLLAGTVVVRERVAVPVVAGVAMPPALAGWAQGVDLSALPPDLALTARQFLGRAHQMTPAARSAMGQRLATELSAFVTPMAPPGTSAEAYLAAVVAARRDRDLERLSGPFRPGPVGGPPPVAPIWGPRTGPMRPAAAREPGPPPPHGSGDGFSTPT